MKTMFLLAVLFAASAANATERHKLQPSDRDQQEMDASLHHGKAFDVNQFLQAPEDRHWTAFYEAATALFAQGRKDEAVKWFYVGQIRGRVAAGVDPDASRNGALLSSFNDGLGKPINEYAGGDLKNWIRQIDAALAWDKAHPMRATPQTVIGVSDVAFDPANVQRVYDQVRAGLVSMRGALAATDPETFARERRKNGLD